MSAYRRLAELLKFCSVFPAIVILPAMAADGESQKLPTATNPNEVASWSGLNYIADANTSVEGGILKIPSGDTYADVDINVGVAENNNITLSKTENNTTDIHGQGSVLYSNGKINSITGTFQNNSITNNVQTVSKASVNGGVFALYKGTSINEINGDFIGNSITAKYTGAGTTEYSNDKQISAGGGAIHIEGQYGDTGATEVNIGTINGNFTNNSATGDGYANGGAIYIKGGADRDGQIGVAASIDMINGDFTNNRVVATTATSENKRASTGGAISVKNELSDVDGASVNVNGGFFENSVTTNATDALGGAIYNEGTVSVAGGFVGNYVSSQTGAANGGAIYNSGNFTVNGGVLFRGNTAAVGGAIWNEGTLVLNNEEKQLSFYQNRAQDSGGAIYNNGAIDSFAHVLFQSNYAMNGGAIWNDVSGNIQGISNSTFASNYAGSGIGGAIKNHGTISLISDTLFRSNASGNGGAIWNDASGIIQEISDVDFESNMAINGEDDAVLLGGAITNSGQINSITNSRFTGNQSGTFGGAIANVNASDGNNKQTININGVRFNGNSAGQSGGAIYNDTRGIITFNGDNVFAGNFANGAANDIHNMGQITVATGETTIGGGITGSGSITISDGATLNIGTTIVKQGNITLNGTLAASIVNMDSYGRLDAITVNIGDTGRLDLSIGAAGRYDILGSGTIDLDKIEYNELLYNISLDGSAIVAETKSVADVASDSKISTSAAAVLVGFANSDDYAMNFASLGAQNALSAGNTEYIESETAKLSPETQPVSQAISSSVQNQISALAANRMAGAVGRSGGDSMDVGYGVWAQGLFNRSKYADKFRGDTRGIAVGADALINSKYTVGLGYAHNETELNAYSRDTDVSSNSIFLYGQYKPTQWYVNALLNYTMSDYTEHTTVFGAAFESNYDVSAFGAQVMTGYDFISGLTPSAGLRYLLITQDAYNNGIADINVNDTNYLTGVAELKYEFEIQSDADLKFSPSIRAAATYDFLSDAAVATVAMSGITPYVVNGDSLSRFGGEFGIGLNAKYQGWLFSVNYDLDLHSHYTSHTGMLKFRYEF